MATLTSLKLALKQEITTGTSCPKQPLSDEQYRYGFNILVGGSGQQSYQNFMIPQLNQLLDPLVSSHDHISVLEIGPGSRSLLGYLPESLRQKIKNYIAFEPNRLFAAELEAWIERESPLFCPRASINVHQVLFVLEDMAGSDINTSTTDVNDKYDIILFCHSMYGMKPATKYIEKALTMLVDEPNGGTVVVFHRYRTLRLNGLVCYHTASFPTGVVSIADNNRTLDSFVSFVAGFDVNNKADGKATQVYCC